MGLFFNNYSKPGPGVSKNEPQKHSFFVFFDVLFRKFWKLIQLNMLYFITCIPLLILVFTMLFMWWGADLSNVVSRLYALPELAAETSPEANTSQMVLSLLLYAAMMIVGFIGTGPATAGFTYVLRNFSREEHSWVFSDFKEHSFKNFKQAACILLIDCVAIFIFNINMRLYPALLGQGLIYSIMFYMFILLLVLFVMMHLYIYTIMVTFDMKLKDILKNSLLFALMKLPMNLLLLILVTAIIGAACLLLPFPFSLLVVAVLGYSLSGLIVQFYAHKVVLRHMVDPALIKTDEADEAPTFEDNV